MAEVGHRKIRRMLIQAHVSGRNQSEPRTKVSDEEIRNGIRRNDMRTRTFSESLHSLGGQCF